MRLPQLNLANFTNSKFYVMFVADLVVFAAALILAYMVRFDFSVPQQYMVQFWAVLPYALAVKALFFFVFGMYRGMWRYTSVNDSMRLLQVTVVQSLFLVVVLAYQFRFQGFPRSVFLIDWMLTLFATSGIRLGIRLGYSLLGGGPRLFGKRKNALIVGAGRAGEIICREMRSNTRLKGYHLVGFVDDAPDKQGRTIHSKAVLGRVDDIPELVRHYEVEEIFIGVSEATGEQMRHIVDTCAKAGVPHKILPALGEIMDGHVDIKDLRDVDYLDLLGRSPVNLDTEEIGRLIRGKTVLVTGCGGTIGSELCRQIVRYEPGRMVLVDAGEFNLYQIQMQLHWEHGFTEYVTVLGSVTDEPLMDRVFGGHKPDVVFHAAAYKHVPMLERNPWQAVRNNVFGTACLMRTAAAHKVPRFVLVSTDKAVRPTNIMGATKRVTELLMGLYRDTDTVFMAVRFGNVLGSSGSVVPLFRRQIEQGGPVTVTHREVTRYFMSITEAAQLILQAGTMGLGGEIFVLDMGIPVRIAEMAEDLIRLSGKEPGKDIKIVFTGLREGEKLYEELITEGEGIVRTEHDKIKVLRAVKGPDAVQLQSLEYDVSQLGQAAENHDGPVIRTLLEKLVPEFLPPENQENLKK